MVQTRRQTRAANTAPAAARKKAPAPARVLSTLPAVFAAEWLTVLVFLFSGCCSNVLSLEFLTR